MANHGRTIYQTSRELAGLTQEDAAQALSCGVRTLSRYESGAARVPEDIALRMTVLYDSQTLGIQHLRLTSPLAAAILPDAGALDPLAASVQVHNGLRRVQREDLDGELLDILEDGVVSPDEGAQYSHILEHLAELSRSILQLRVAAAWKRPPGRGNVQAARAPGLRRESLQ